MFWRESPVCEGSSSQSEGSGPDKLMETAQASPSQRCTAVVPPFALVRGTPADAEPDDAATVCNTG